MDCGCRFWAKEAELRNSDSHRKLLQIQECLLDCGSHCGSPCGSPWLQDCRTVPTCLHFRRIFEVFLIVIISLILLTEYRHSSASPLQEAHYQQSLIMSWDLSYGCCHGCTHYKHYRTLATQRWTSPIMSWEVGYGCRRDGAVSDWNFK